MPCESASALAPLTNKTITDWSELHPYKPAVIFDPATRGELVSAVLQGEDLGGGLRAQGACYSLSLAAKADKVLIRTTALNKFLSTPRDADDQPLVPPPFDPADDPCVTPKLAGERIRKGHAGNRLVVRPGAEPKDGAILVHVEAGVRIKQLLRDLDEIGHALPTMGSGGCQTLAGAISTGTHNSDDRAPLVDNVRAIHLVGPGGQEWWIEPSAGLLEPGALLDMKGICREIRIVRDDDFFHAAMVSAGRFGVIYAVVLEAPAQYRLVETSKPHKWSDIAKGLRKEIAEGDGGPPGSAHFNQYALDLSGRDRVWITKRNLTTEPDAPEPEASTDFIAVLCRRTKDLEGALVALIEPLTAFKVTVAPIPVMGLVWAANIDVLVGKLAAALHTSKTIGDFVAVAVDEMRDVDEALFGPAAPAIKTGIKELIRGIFDDAFTERRVGRSNKLLDTHTYSRDGCMSANSTELFFDASKTGYLDFVADVRAAAGEDGFVPGYASLRFVRRSEALLAPERWDQTVAIEVAVLRSTTVGDVYDKFFKRVLALADEHGAIPHWGQQLRLDPERLEALYGEDLATWQWVLSELEEGGPPTFSSDFSRDCGLEDGGRTVDEHRDGRTGGVLVSALMAHTVV